MNVFFFPKPMLHLVEDFFGLPFFHHMGWLFTLSIWPTSNNLLNGVILKGILVTDEVRFIGSFDVASPIAGGHKIMALDLLSFGSIEVLPRRALFEQCCSEPEEILGQPQTFQLEAISHFAAMRTVLGWKVATTVEAGHKNPVLRFSQAGMSAISSLETQSVL